jgi:hypothetical protein
LTPARRRQLAIYYRVSTDDQSCKHEERDLRMISLLPSKKALLEGIGKLPAELRRNTLANIRDHLIATQEI